MTDEFRQRLIDKLRNLFGADTTLNSLAALAGDASSRRYYRATVSGPAAPASVIVMELPGDAGLPLSSEELAIFKESPRELPFLNVHRFLTRVGVHVPAIYGHWPEERLILLEDLGDTSLWDKVQSGTPEDLFGWYRKAIDELLILHTRGTAARSDECIAFQQRFDAKLYLWEFDHFIEWGLEKRPRATVGSATVGSLRDCFSDIAADLEPRSTCLSHRDYHSWNLMIHNGAVRVIDFQDALLAPPQYDLASLLNDRITDSLVTPELEESLVRYYIEQSAALTGRALDDQEFFRIYRLSAIQRDLKVIGRFYYLDLVKHKPGYRKFIAPTARRLLRNLPQTPQTRPLLPVLRVHFESMQ